MDTAEPPRISFESTASCAHGHQAEMELKAALLRARAPAPGWLVAVRIHNAAGHTVQADGDISDERGAPLGHREFRGKPSDCDGLARAVGVWASLVLDAEVRRPRTTSGGGDKAAESASPAENADAGITPIPSPNAPLPDPAWPPPDDAPSPPDAPATYESGVGTFVMSGIGRGNAFVGGTPFLVIAATKRFFFRPAVAVGELLNGSSKWAAVRLDGCFRAMGQHASPGGLQMDLCGGVDVGSFGDAGLELPFVSPGPRIDLGVDLGSDFSVLRRPVVEAPMTEVAMGRFSVVVVSPAGHISVSCKGGRAG